CPPGRAGSGPPATALAGPRPAGLRPAGGASVRGAPPVGDDGEPRPARYRPGPPADAVRWNVELRAARGLDRTRIPQPQRWYGDGETGLPAGHLSARGRRHLGV